MLSRNMCRILTALIPTRILFYFSYTPGVIKVNRHNNILHKRFPMWWGFLNVYRVLMPHNSTFTLGCVARNFCIIITRHVYREGITVIESTIMILYISFPFSDDEKKEITAARTYSVSLLRISNSVANAARNFAYVRCTTQLKNDGSSQLGTTNWKIEQPKGEKEGKMMMMLIRKSKVNKEWQKSILAWFIKR